MPTLEWIGKEKVINLHLEVPFRVFGRLTGDIFIRQGDFGRRRITLG